MCVRQLTVNVNRGTRMRRATAIVRPRAIVASAVTEDRMPRKKAFRMKTLAFWKPAKRRRKTARLPWWKTTPALAGATICVMLAAVLIAAYQSAEPGPMTPERTAPAPMSRIEPSTATPAMPAMETAPADAAATPAKTNRVTITGCLERADEAFRLKDTEGEDAPKSRSWKSAFLKRGRAAVDVVDSANRLNLSNHVGERVTVTGTLVDREIRVRSLQRVAASCSIAPRVKV
jgi:hypothetical protein